MIRSLNILLLAVTVMTFAGCSSEISAQKSYSLQVQRQGDAVSQHCDSSIKVARFTASKPYGYKWFVYCKDDMQFETDYYNQFLLSPDEAVQEQTFGWLSSSAAWENVLRWNEQADYQYELKGHIKALYGDFSREGDFRAVVEIEFLLAEKATGELVLDETFSASIPFNEKTPEALLCAYVAGVEDVLTYLEEKLLSVVK